MIKSLFLKGKRVGETHQKLVKILGKNIFSEIRVRHLRNHFKKKNSIGS